MDYDNYILNEYISFITPITSSDSFQEYVQILALSGFGASFTSIIVGFFGAEYLSNNAALVQCYYEKYLKNIVGTQIATWVTALQTNASYNLNAYADMLEEGWDFVSQSIQVVLNYFLGQLSNVSTFTATSTTTC